MNATEYLRHWEKNKVWTHLAWPKHQRRFDICAVHLKGREMADVGCAYGHSTHELAKRRPDSTWIGIDFDPGAIEIARRCFPEMAFYYVPDGFRGFVIDGRPALFDSVVCSEVIEHVERDEEFVLGLLGMARKRVVVTTPDRKVSDPGHLRVYTERSLGRLFAGTDFEIVHDGPFFYAVVNIGD